jgi:hypothetical protein
MYYLKNNYLFSIEILNNLGKRLIKFNNFKEKKEIFRLILQKRIKNLDLSIFSYKKILLILF